jgi:hypothetical protein
LLEDLGNIFTGSAKKTFGTFNCKNIDSKINKNKNGQNQKPWFDHTARFLLLMLSWFVACRLAPLISVSCVLLRLILAAVRLSLTLTLLKNNLTPSKLNQLPLIWLPIISTSMLTPIVGL